MASAPNPEPAMEEGEADRRLTANNQDPDALTAKADHRLLAKDHRAASAYYRAALQMMEQAGRGAGWLASRIEDTIIWLDQNYVRHIVERLEKAGFPQSEWHPRFAKSLAMMVGQLERAPEPHSFPQMPMTFFYAGMEHHEFVPKERFDWAERLEAQTDAIRAEAQAILDDDANFSAYVKSADNRPHGDVHGMLENKVWSSFELAEDGDFAPERVAKCPNTHAALEDVPLCRITNRAPTPMFSRLAAGERIPPHTGMINVRYICHLPLIVPGDGTLRVGGSKRHWEEGKLLVFDDSVEHEAWNDADKDRLVLIFDVWRPELEDAERAQLNALFAAVDSY